MPPSSDPLALLTERSKEFSPKLAAAADYVLDRPEDAALLTLRDLAERAGVHASTMNRLGAELGYGGFGGMKQAFQSWLRAHRAGFSERVRSLQQVPQPEGRQDALLSRLFDDQHANLEISRCATAPETFSAAAALIERANSVFVLGLRSVGPIAATFHYAYQMFRTNAVLVQSPAVDGLRRIKPGDVLLVAGVAPYSAATVTSTEVARDKGATIIAISDDEDSPLATQAEVHFRIGAVGPSLFPSVAAGVSVAETLIAVLVARGGPEVAAAIAECEADLSRFSTYWWPEDVSGPTTDRAPTP